MSRQLHSRKGDIVKYLVTVLFAASLVASVASARSATPVPGVEKEIIEHGGGCRKSSPPGQCCHMNHKTGVVHCH